jgi:hypothetical protein
MLLQVLCCLWASVAMQKYINNERMKQADNQKVDGFIHLKKANR